MNIAIVAEPVNPQMKFLFKHIAEILLDSNDWINNFISNDPERIKGNESSKNLLFNGIANRDFAETIMTASLYQEFSCVLLGSESKCSAIKIAQLPSIRDIGNFCLSLGCTNVNCHSEYVKLEYKNMKLVDDLLFLSLIDSFNQNNIQGILELELILLRGSGKLRCI